MKGTTLSFRRSKRTILFGLLAAGSVTAYFLAPVLGGIPPIDANLPGVTETATFALG